MSSTGEIILPNRNFPKSLASIEYVNLAYFVLGILTTCMTKTMLTTISSSATIMEVSEYDIDYFIAHLTCIIICSYIIGTFISFLLIPRNTFYICLFVWIIGAGFYIHMLNTIIVPSLSSGFIYIILTVLLSISCGICNMTSIGTSTDHMLYGSVSNRVISIFAGNAIGTLFISINSYFLMYEMKRVDITGEIIQLLGMGIPSVFILASVIIISVYFINYSKSATNNQLITEQTNIINSLKYYLHAIKTLGCCWDIIFMICLTQSLESFFNIGSIICTIDPFPQIEDPLISLIIVVLISASDLAGRLLIYVLNVAEDNTVAGFSSNVYLNRIARMKYSWIALFVVRIPTGIMIMLERHYVDYEAISLSFTQNFILAFSCVNHFIRGIIISSSYSVLFETAYFGTLTNHGLDKQVPKDEPLECMDRRASAVHPASIAVMWVHLIEILCSALFLYIGYKYQQVIYDVEDDYISTGQWATDHINEDFMKLIWWINEVLSVIWSDLMTPFECTN